MITVTHELIAGAAALLHAKNDLALHVLSCVVISLLWRLYMWWKVEPEVQRHKGEKKCSFSFHDWVAMILASTLVMVSICLLFTV